MIKLILSIFMLGLTTFSHLDAATVTCKDVEFKVGYFYPISPRLREIFPGIRLMYQIEYTRHLSPNYGAWFNISLYPDNGHSTCEKNDIKISLVPLSAGIKFFFKCFDCVDLSIGGGGAYYFLKTRNEGCPCIGRYTSDHNFGAVLNAQLNFPFGCNRFASIFADYLFLPLDAPGGCHNLGGIVVGAALGMGF